MAMLEYIQADRLDIHNAGLIFHANKSLGSIAASPECIEDLDIHHEDLANPILFHHGIPQTTVLHTRLFISNGIAEIVRGI